METRDQKRIEREAADQAWVSQLLTALTEVEREALKRVYQGFHNVAETESALQLAPGHIAQLRMELRKQFLARLVGGKREEAAGQNAGTE